MFHTYVEASSGRRVDIDRARWLMDDALLAEAERELVAYMCPQGFNPFDIATAERNHAPGWKAQRVWRAYCAKHAKKYGDEFEPDVNPDWDR